MNRLTTDNPQNNIEVVMNMVYGKDGWQHIRHGEDGMPTVDFCLMLCKERGCTTPDDYGADTNERKDEMLCDCAFENCPVATVYAALSGFGHVRGRLKMYEDADMMPPQAEKKVFYFAVADGCCDPETGEKDDAGLQISADGILTAEDAIRLAEHQLPCYAGRLRQITEEEYLRDFGDDE